MKQSCNLEQNSRLDLDLHTCGAAFRWTRVGAVPGSSLYGGDGSLRVAGNAAPALHVQLQGLLCCSRGLQDVQQLLAELLVERLQQIPDSRRKGSVRTQSKKDF